MQKRDKVESLDADHFSQSVPKRESCDDHLLTEDEIESFTLDLIHRYRLRESTTLSQIALWSKTQDFARNSESLRTDLGDRIRALAARFNVDREAIMSATGSPKLPITLNWRDIRGMLTLFEDAFLEVTLSDEVLADMLGFPDEKYSDLAKCVKQGVELEVQKILAARSR